MLRRWLSLRLIRRLFLRACRMARFRGGLATTCHLSSWMTVPASAVVTISTGMPFTSSSATIPRTFSIARCASGLNQQIARTFPSVGRRQVHPQPTQFALQPLLFVGFQASVVSEFHGRLEDAFRRVRVRMPAKGAKANQHRDLLVTRL